MSEPSGQSASAPSGYRMSRWNDTSRPPQDLQDIIAQLGKVSRRRGYFVSRNSLRGALGAVNRDYQPRGAADDMIRFLMNTGIILPEGSKLYYDGQRAAYVAGEIAAKRRPAPPVDAQERIKAVIAAADSSVAQSSGDQLGDEGAGEPEEVSVMVFIEGLEAYTLDGLRCLSNEEIADYSSGLEAHTARCREAAADVRTVLSERAEAARAQKAGRLAALREEQRKLQQAAQSKADEIARLEGELGG